MIIISDAITLRDDEITLIFSRASGPGGQNVNKVSTAVQLRFHVKNSTSLSSDIKTRLMKLAHHLMTDQGELLISARRFRTQASNRLDALRRLAQLIRMAEKKPRLRIKTTPTSSSKLNRIIEKEAVKVKKNLRKKINLSDD